MKLLTFLTNIWLPLEPILSLIPLPIGPDKNPRSISMLLSSIAPIPGPILSKLELIRSSPIPIPPVTLFIPPIPPPGVSGREGRKDLAVRYFWLKNKKEKVDKEKKRREKIIFEKKG